MSCTFSCAVTCFCWLNQAPTIDVSPPIVAPPNAESAEITDPSIFQNSRDYSITKSPSVRPVVASFAPLRQLGSQSRAVRKMTGTCPPGMRRSGMRSPRTHTRTAARTRQRLASSQSSHRTPRRRRVDSNPRSPGYGRSPSPWNHACHLGLFALAAWIAPARPRFTEDKALFAFSGNVQDLSGGSGSVGPK